MKKTVLFSWLFICFLLGTFLSDILREQWVPWSSIGILSLWIFPNIRWRAFVFAFAFLFGSLWLLNALRAPSENTIDFYATENGSFLVVQGIISRYPEERLNKVRIVIESEKIFLDNQWKKISGKVLVNLPAGTNTEFGDRIEIEGKLRVPGKIESFSYDRYLEKEGIYAYFPNATGKIFSRDPEEFSVTENFEKFLFRLRSWMEKSIRSSLPEPQSSFATALLLGAEYRIPERILEDFNASGLRHLLALSGMNITLLIIVFFWIFQILKKPIRMLITLTIIAMFITLSGASASVVRAGIMGGIGLIALHSGRKTSVFMLLAMAVSIMTLWNPFMILSDASLQLSAFAVLGIAMFVPLFDSSIPKKILPNFYGIREILFATLSAQIGTLPLSLFLFERFSIIAPIANLLVVPFISIAMFFSFASALPILQIIILPFSWIILSSILWGASFFASIPFAQFEISINWWQMTILYGGIFCLWIVWKKRSERKK
jgi:competence protein ComEC